MVSHATLTEPFINAQTRRAAVKHQRLSLSDPGLQGLQLRITPYGTRTWVLYCRDSAGKPRRFPLGQYPEIGLALARRRATAMREQVRQGADPIAAARLKRAAATADSADTLAALIDLYARQRGTMLRTWSEMKRRIECVFADLLDTRLVDLRLGALQIQADQWPAQLSAGAAVRYLRPILKWAAAPGRAYVAKELAEIVQPAQVAKRGRVLARDELARLLPALEARRDNYAAALKLMLLTLTRREETVGACWGEFQLERAEWTIPEKRNKSGRRHVVPLPPQAVELLRAIQPEPATPGALVFVTATGRPLDNWDRLTKRIMAASGTSGWHRHDLRRTGATMLGEMGVEPHVIEAALNHLHIGGQLAALYNQARYRPQVRQALQQLADALDGIAADNAAA